MGQDPEVSLIASRYIMYMIPSFFIFGLFDAHRLMLNCMEETTIATSLVVIALPFHAVLGYYIVYKLGMGWVGVNISIFITYVLLLIAMTVATVMIKNPEVQKAWVWPNRESFRDWWEITVLAVPGAFLYMVEWTACEGLVIFSGLIGVAELSAFGILMILMPTILCFTFGMQYAVTIYVGNSLGDGNHNKAYTQAKASFLMVACATVVVGTIVILGRSQMSMLFTEDAQVRSLFMIGLIFVIIETIPDSNQFVLQGIIKSLGKQDAAFAPVVFCQILIGMPTAYLLGVHYEYGIPGLLMGLGIGNTLLCGFYYRLAYGEDWYEVTRRVRQNLDGKLYLEN
jgi:MATE family multidrug resistance protein